ncbi:hypothetical protein SBOR_3960 [Sclerotinia borealis F-4128]|uniref:Protamine P1 n=1 Tax=Sclerotinia borealis (strain F-4128) TaxID=1432307 RepID=W9CLW2_SCLBF|nr:hypothetical protein SBOR_3960 [Sclerotinia borealis F-4128]
MSLHMSGRSLNSDNDDEPIYFTPTYKSEDLICEGSDTEANPRAIIEKRRRYEQCAERVLRGQLPIIETARLRGPFYKDNKSEWLNPWRHQEGTWWKPGSKDMLFKREDVLRRAREHGRKDMSPAEALAWCRRDARRQAEEMGVHDYSDMQCESATGPDTEGFVVDETLHGDIMMEEEGDLSKGIRSSIRPPIPQVPKSTTAHANTKDFEDTPIIGSSTSNAEDYGRQPESWTGIKRPVDVAWLKGSHVSKRARWEDPAVSSPTPLPHATSQTFQYKDTGTMIVAQSRTSHKIQPRSGLSLETPRQELASRKSHASMQQSDTTSSAETSFHTNIGQQGQRRSISMFELERELERRPTNLCEDSPEPYSSIPIYTPAGKQASVSQTSATKPVTSPRLPSHPKIGVLHDENHETPGNMTFVTDVAPSSVNLEHFQFRKKRRRKSDPPDISGRSFTVIGEDSHMPVSEDSRPNFSLQSDATFSTPFTHHPIEKAEEFSISWPTKSVVTKASSRRSSQADESWRTTQEEIGITPSTMSSGSRITIKGGCSPQSEDIGNSWVTTQDDFNHAPTSSVSMDITQIYRSSNFVPQPNLVERMETPTIRNYENTTTLQSSPLKQPSAPQSARHLSKSSPKLSARPQDYNKLGVPMPCENLDGSSTQSYNTSPVNSITITFKSPRACILPQNLGSSQKLPQRTTSTSNEGFVRNVRNDNVEHDSLTHVQISDDRKWVETEGAVSVMNFTLEGEQIEDVTSLQAHQESNIDIELQADSAAAFEDLEDAEDMQGVAQGKMQEEVQATMRAELDADDVPNSALLSGQTSTSSSLARTNNITTPNLTSIHKARSVDQIPKSSMPNQFTPLFRDEEDVLSLASTQDLTEYLLEAAAKERVLNVPSEGTGSDTVSNPELQSGKQTATQPRIPQSPWVAAQAIPMIAPIVLTSTEVVEPLNAESPSSGWQKEERPVTPDNDIIRPFRDLMTPSPPPEDLNTPEIEQRPSNTQLLVEAATQNPWVNGSNKKSTKRKRVSFGTLDEDPVPSQRSSQRQRRSPSPEGTYRTGAFGNKVARFDDDVTDMNSFQNHFSAIRSKSEGEIVPKINSSVKRGSAITKYKTTLSDTTNLIASSPAIGAMAEAFIAADRDSSRERERRLTISPSRNRKYQRKSYKTFEDEDEDDSGIQPSDSHFSTNVALNETSSNIKLEEHTPGDFLDEVEDFLGGDWSVEGELKKATSTEFELATPKRESKVHSRRSLFAIENVWS